MPCLEVLDNGGPETAAHEFVHPGQAVLFFEVFRLAWPLLRASGAHHFHSDAVLVGVHRDGSQLACHGSAPIRCGGIDLEALEDRSRAVGQLALVKERIMFAAVLLGIVFPILETSSRTNIDSVIHRDHALRVDAVQELRAACE